MRKTLSIIFLSLVLSLLTINFIRAAPPEDSTPPGQIEKEETTGKEVKDKIEDLKERVATRVAELRAQAKRAFFGQIREKRENTLTLARGEKEQSVTVDEETTIIRLGPNKERTVIDLEALEVGERVVVFGTLDLDQKTLLAKRILSRTLPKNVHGKVKEVDIDTATITVSSKKEEFIVDYEIRTRCQMWQRGEGLQKCGLSKIEIGDRVFVHGEVNTKDENRLTALRILLLPSQSSPPLSPSPTP